MSMATAELGCTIEQPRVRSQKLAACLAGVTVGLVAGFLAGLACMTEKNPEALYVGLIAGPIFGFLFGTRIASFQTILGGAAFGGFLPFGLIIIDGIRRGKFNDLARVAKDFQEPKSLMIAGCILASGVILGASLVACRKGYAKLLYR